MTLLFIPRYGPWNLSMSRAFVAYSLSFNGKLFTGFLASFNILCHDKVCRFIWRQPSVDILNQTLDGIQAITVMHGSYVSAAKPR